LGWSALAVLWGSLAAVMYLLSLVGIRENPAFSRSGQQTSWREQIQVVANNRTFLIVLGINFTTRFILAVILAIMPFYADIVLQIPEEQLSTLLGMLLVASGLSLVGWQAVIKRWGTRRSMTVSMAISAVFAIPLLFAEGAMVVGIALGLLGIAIGGTVLGPDLLFAEVVDDDYVRTGLRREGMYRGILGFIFRFPPAVAGLVLGEGLSLAGYDSDLAAGMQPEAVITVIRTFSAVLPMIAIVAGIGLLVAYPLHGERLDRIQRQATAMRGRAAAEYDRRAAVAGAPGDSS